MKTRFFLFSLILCLLITLFSPVAYSEVDYNSTYKTAIKLSSNDLTNLNSLQDAISMLEQTGAYSYSKSYLMYFQALLELQKNYDFDTASLRLVNCSRQTGFVSDLQERNLPSCDELLKYIDARKLESAGRTDEAYSAFVDLTVLDSPDRAFNLSLSVANATSAPTTEEVSPTSTPTPIQTVEPSIESTPQLSVPVLSEVYPGSDAHLRKSGDEGFRVYSYTGPGKTFVPSGGYKPYKQRKITVFFEEDGWVLADVQYQTSEERVVSLPKYSFDSIGNIPTVSRLEYYTGTTTASITPSWGPDNRFNSVSSLVVEKGTKLKVFFQENGFVYAEYVCTKGTVRMWLPANNVEVKDAIVTYSNTPITPAGQSSFK